MYTEILNKIKEYDDIAIFRHQRPDGDAMFSALALAQFINDNFPDKTVKVGGEDKFDLVSRNDDLSLAFIKRSLAIVLDTSTSERIDDERALKAKQLIKIDHHPINDDYGIINLVDAKASACSEVLAAMFLSKDFKGLDLSAKVCEYLYCGIISDTINFRTTNVTAETLSIASKLVKRGDLKIAELVEYIMDKDIEAYVRSTKIRNLLKIKSKFGYIILKETDLKKLNISQAEAKTNIDEIGKIKDLQIWSIAIENEGLFDVSVRSKRGHTINTVCSQYGGGGHKNAAAAKKLSRNDLKKMYKTLEKMSENEEI